MFSYEKRLEYPVNIKNPNPKIAQVIISQYGGPNGECGAALRYLSQRYTMSNRKCMGALTDIGTEELSHMEMICAIVHQLTCNLSPEEIVAAGMQDYYTDHTLGLYPIDASGNPFSAATFQSVGDPITDLTEDLAAEQKARTTYDNILRLVKDPDVADPIRFLREREIVHFQRFGECLRTVQEQLDAKNFYAFNISFDKPNCAK
ncbi:MAG: manganese catalase family protein [Lachnospiraceae bacterium]|nr:manganese catalase family protein [Lachnospiraceae bacterium]